jgi:hypothetical protein
MLSYHNYSNFAVTAVIAFAQATESVPVSVVDSVFANQAAYEARLAVFEHIGAQAASVSAAALDTIASWVLAERHPESLAAGLLAVVKFAPTPLQHAAALCRQALSWAEGHASFSVREAAVAAAGWCLASLADDQILGQWLSAISRRMEPGSSSAARLHNAESFLLGGHASLSSTSSKIALPAAEILLELLRDDDDDVQDVACAVATRVYARGRAPLHILHAIRRVIEDISGRFEGEEVVSWLVCVALGRSKLTHTNTLFLNSVGGRESVFIAQLVAAILFRTPRAAKDALVGASVSALLQRLAEVSTQAGDASSLFARAAVADVVNVSQLYCSAIVLKALAPSSAEFAPAILAALAPVRLALPPLLTAALDLACAAGRHPGGAVTTYLLPDMSPCGK